MKYLQKSFQFFMYFDNFEKRFLPEPNRGGPPVRIPKKFRCVSGKHDKRLTQCYCALFEEKKNAKAA